MQSVRKNQSLKNYGYTINLDTSFVKNCYRKLLNFLDLGYY